MTAIKYNNNNIRNETINIILNVNVVAPNSNYVNVPASNLSLEHFLCRNPECTNLITYNCNNPICFIENENDNVEYCINHRHHLTLMLPYCESCEIVFRNIDSEDDNEDDIEDESDSE